MNIRSTTLKALSLILLCSISATHAFPGMDHVMRAWNALPSKEVVSQSISDAYASIPNREVIAASARQGFTTAQQAALDCATSAQRYVSPYVDQARDAVQPAFNAAHQAAIDCAVSAQRYATPYVNQARNAVQPALNAINEHPYIAAATAGGALALIGAYVMYVKHKAHKPMLHGEEVAREDLYWQAHDEVLGKSHHFDKTLPEILNALENEVANLYNQLLAAESH